MWSNAKPGNDTIFVKRPVFSEDLFGFFVLRIYDVVKVRSAEKIQSILQFKLKKK